jgi:hypothetical protein
MLKYSLCFAAGMVTTAVIAYEGHAGAGAWFLVGLLFTLIVQAAVLANTGRAARFARFLNVFVAAWSDRQGTRAEASRAAKTVPIRAVAAPAAPADDDENDSDEHAAMVEDVKSALVNMSGKVTKADRKRFEQIAEECAETLAGAPFDEVFRLAVTTLRSYKAA